MQLERTAFVFIVSGMRGLGAFARVAKPPERGVPVSVMFRQIANTRVGHEADMATFRAFSHREPPWWTWFNLATIEFRSKYMKMMRLLVCLTALSCAPFTQGAIVSINPTNSGHCIYSSAICYGDGNVGASLLDGGATGIRHFMLFDLSGLAGSVTAARLEIDASDSRAYSSFFTSEQYVVTGLSVDRGLITNRTAGTGARNVYDAIAAGTTYGSTSVSTPLNDWRPHAMPAVQVDLAGGLADFTAALGSDIALGGYIPYGYILFQPMNGPFDATGTRLVLDIDATAAATVPAPGSLLLVLAGLLPLVAVRRLRTSVLPASP
ncbi:MAG: hypothetical protein KDH93_23930 [Rhodoferax sp.]|nr:hypothetical protein [Rhodoferax sp.]MCP5262850.1 hypothetical protein [Rhodoferax sp.]